MEATFTIFIVSLKSGQSVAESEAKNIVLFWSKTCTLPAPAVWLAVKVVAAEGLEVERVSETLIKEAALAFWTKSIPVKRRKIRQ